ncbi:hypothetical protein NDR87_18930 [Nocardia sp. CDC159]|uniref:Uncharacterized protein n=1 Tax=Nocardia pulmonis TaxID=2951408 RepID=A0A9X2E8G2_9NOCA|nr:MULTISPECIES: hypothetical protein [Nocardia]MCM6776234.1 hypothetical protein [Nocardia pulmonis]MCM6788440.1 hypothetical protein [Nocardia sp. CDC159]
MNIIALPGSPAAADVAADLRALADIAETDEFVAAMLARLISGGTLWPNHATDYQHRDHGAQVMGEAIRRFKPIAAEPIRKEFRDGGDGYFDAVVPLKALTLRLTDLREVVCERVVTGVETVTEEVPDPEYVAAAPKVTVTREVESFEWKCAPILAASEAVTR